jgi:hypothetical protein
MNALAPKAICRQVENGLKVLQGFQVPPLIWPRDLSHLELRYEGKSWNLKGPAADSGGQVPTGGNPRHRIHKCLISAFFRVSSAYQHIGTSRSRISTCDSADASGGGLVLSNVFDITRDLIISHWTEELGELFVVVESSVSVTSEATR